MFRLKALLTCTAAGLAVALLIAGCAKTSAPQAGPAQASRATSHEQDPHEHARGIKAMGDYHVKLLVEEGGVLKLLMLGKDEAEVAHVENQEIKAHVRAADAKESTPVTLKPDPQAGDPAGRTSQFAGELPEELRGKSLVVNARLTIAGKAYFPELETGSASADTHHVKMPKGGKNTQAERDLYLNPGGLYTQADIEANGNTIPTLKFKGIDWPHDENLKAGDTLCPVTKQKADPRCAWIVNGKKYEFCCPPCVNKFVRWAKTEPDKIKDPDTYVFKD